MPTVDDAIAGPGWEHFAHDADIGVRGRGDTLAEAFEQAALALTALITAPAGVQARLRVPIECEAADHESLFVQWLNSLVYEMATRRMLFSACTVHITGSRLTAEVRGEPVDVPRHQPAVEVKGATYTALKVHQEHGRWVAQTVVDV